MCGDCNDPFHGLDDDLDDAISGVEVTVQDVEEGRELAAKTLGTYVENCSACRGTGRWHMTRPCFKCKGTGKLTFRTSPQQRNSSRVAREKKADQLARDRQADREAFKRDHAADYAWIINRSESFEFARGMRDALDAYGSLTEKQHATVTRLRLADEERAAARRVEAEQRAANAPAIDIRPIETAFAKARAAGIKRPKMKLAGVKFSEAPAHGVNAGAVYVVRVSDDQYLGKIINGKFTRVRECTEQVERDVLAIAADPKNAAIAYGKQYGICAICSHELSDPESVARGIGPICADRFGW